MFLKMINGKCRLKVLIFAIVMVPMSGCTVMPGRGTYIEQERLSSLKENETTGVEVIELLGKPSRINPGIGDRGQIFVYDYMKTKAGMAWMNEGGKRQIVSLFIDDKDVLRKITVSDKPLQFSTYKNWIEPEKLSALKEDGTTRAEVIELLGKPDAISPGAGGRGEIFTYDCRKPERRLSDTLMFVAIGPVLYQEHRGEDQTVNLFIDDTGILKKITVNERPYKIKSGILAK